MTSPDRNIDAPTPAGATRRRLLIFPCDNPADGRAIVTLDEFSPGEIVFTHTRPFRSASQFIVRLVPGAGRAVPLLYTVRRCSVLGRNRYHVAAAFTRRLDCEDERPAPMVPAAPVSAQPQQEPAAGALPISLAEGFHQSRTLIGTTRIGWDRVLELHREGDRVWINLHPPGRESGWGMYVQADELRRSVNQVARPEPHTFQMNAAA